MAHMSFKILSVVKLVVISAAAILLAIGWFMDNVALSFAGVVAYGVTCLGEIVWQIRASLYYRQSRDDKWNIPKTKVEKVAGFLYGTVTVSGLLAPFVAAHHKAAESGFVIWIVAVFTWFMSGIIAQSVAGIPLRMTYGGWKGNRHRRRR